MQILVDVTVFVVLLCRAELLASHYLAVTQQLSDWCSKAQAALTEPVLVLGSSSLDDVKAQLGDCRVSASPLEILN